MSSEETWIENLEIYIDNLSIYYVLCAVVSLVALIFTVWHQKKWNRNTPNNSQPLGRGSSSKEESSSNIEENFPEDTIKSSKGGRSALLEEVAQSLSDDQLLEEKEIEKQQLENIFELLKQQQDKFQIGTIEELQDQMKLYRG